MTKASNIGAIHRRKIAHVINPFRVSDNSDLFHAQPITFETMRKAKRKCQAEVDVTLYSAHYLEDVDIIPKDFIPLKPLNKSILDVGKFKLQRKLPLIADILSRLYKITDAEYLVYTNVDIALMPTFYTAVNQFIRKGHDAFIINRRTISTKYRKVGEISQMYNEIGKPHPGYDCFIFKRDTYPKFRLRNICIGINYVGLALYKNLECHAINFKVFEDLHLTFHIGNDKPWKLDEFADYRKHNENEYNKVIDDLKKEYNFMDRKRSDPLNRQNKKANNITLRQDAMETKFNKLRKKRIFFILSTGRSGTQTIAKSLSQNPECICLHEPLPPLILESSAYRYGRVSCREIKKILLQTRNPVFNGKLYGESNQTLSLIVPSIVSAFPNSKLIWLIRNGLDVVSSIFSRQWYTGHSANHERYENCPPIEKTWIDGRIRGDLCSDVPFAKWKSMSPFARCCWYWSYINRTIEFDLNNYCSSSNIRKVMLEDLNQKLPEIAKWLGLDPSYNLKCGKHNRAHYKLYPWQKWTFEERETFLYWCGPMMDRLYPNWRITNNKFFDNLSKVTKTEEVQSKILQKGLKKNKKKSKELDTKKHFIYYTPQLKKQSNISVYITSYNQKNYLVEAIESVLGQTLKPHQIIVVDDFSDDGSQELISKYAKKYPKLVFPIYHTRNYGVVKTRTDALNAVTGDYVTYLDGDDRYLSKKLEYEFEILERNQDAQIVFSNNYYINADGKRIGIWADEETPKQGYVFKETFARRFPKKNLFRMEIVNYQALKSVGFHDSNVTIYEDYDLRIRLTKHFKTVYCDKPLSEIRIHRKGLSNTDPIQHVSSLEYIYHKNRSLIANLDESDRDFINKGFNNFVDELSVQVETTLCNKKNKKIPNKMSCQLIDSVTMSEKASNKNLGDNLIFLISQPRSGSTLFQRMLSGHPEVHSTAEPWVMLHPLYALRENGIETEYRADLAKQGLEDFLMQVPEGSELYRKAIRNLGNTLYNRMLELSGKRYFLDKTPRYYHIIPELYSIFPNAKFIILLRNPIAVLSSVLKTWCENRVEALQIQNIIDLVKGPVCLLNGIKSLKERAIVVDYESLVQYPERMMLRVCNRIGIPYYENLLNYGSRPKPIGRFGDLVGICKHSHPVTNSINKWKKNVQSNEFSDFAQKFLNELGENVVYEMGYNYHELKSFLSQENSKIHKKRSKLETDDIYNNEMEKFIVEEHTNASSKTVHYDSTRKETNLGKSNNLSCCQSRKVNNNFLKCQSEPLISVITPSLNQGKFIEQTIQSVLNQNYTNFEHIIIDGGSVDNTNNILNKYPHLKCISEKDSGQSHALNKGLRIARGDIIAWINSDDWYELGAFRYVTEFFNNNPNKNIVMGNCNLVNEEGKVFETVINRERGGDELKKYWIGKSIPTQPAVFFKRKLLKQYGYADEELNYAMDYDLWMRFSRHNRFYHIDKNVANYRFHKGAKGGAQNWEVFVPEWKKVYKRYAGKKRNSPEVSVIIPCYNHGKYLGEAVESVISQTFQEFEIIIVNDGSTDNTKEIGAKLVNENTHHSIKLINQENSGQPAIARNNGIAVAKGKYILPLDADDKLHPQAIENYLNRLNKGDNGPVVVFGWLQSFGSDDSLWAASEFEMRQMLHRNQIPASSLYHRSVWEYQKGYRTNVPGFEDWDFWIGAIRIGAKFLNVRQVTTYYRKTTDVSLIDRGIRSHEWNFANIVMNNKEMYMDSEIQWSENYLAVHTVPPQKRELHGPQDRFPSVGAMLVMSHPERYTENEVVWANSYLGKQPLMYCGSGK